MNVFYQSCLFRDIQRPETSDINSKQFPFSKPTTLNYEHKLFQVPIATQLDNLKQFPHLPYISNNQRAISKGNNGPYKPPATANSTHYKFAFTKARYQFLQQAYHQNKRPAKQLNTSESKESRIYTDAYNPNFKPSTAVVKNHGRPQRVSSAKVRGTRPDSRYKKETICSKLDLGVNMKKDDYYIPLLEWGDDPHNKEQFPNCWKIPHFSQIDEI